MPETFTPITMTNGAGVALDENYFNGLHTAMEQFDDRSAALERGVVAPVTITYAATITPDAAVGALFRCVATGNLTLNDPINGSDGQTIVLEIQASGADRTLSFSGDTASAVTIPSGQWWRGSLTYRASGATWVLVD